MQMSLREEEQAWIYVWVDHNNVYMMIDSQSLIIKGILAVIKSMIEGKSTAEILNWTPTFIDTTSVGKQLSVDRRI
jgi:sulfur transfer protein SufE